MNYLGLECLLLRLMAYGVRISELHFVFKLKAGTAFRDLETSIYKRYDKLSLSPI
jgi:hypothetical protein